MNSEGSGWKEGEELKGWSPDEAARCSEASIISWGWSNDFKWVCLKTADYFRFMLWAIFISHQTNGILWSAWLVFISDQNGWWRCAAAAFISGCYTKWKKALVKSDVKWWSFNSSNDSTANSWFDARVLWLQVSFHGCVREKVAHNNSLWQINGKSPLVIS